jgi:hypothetical protein
LEFHRGSLETLKLLLAPHFIAGDILIAGRPDRLQIACRAQVRSPVEDRHFVCTLIREEFINR